MTYEQLSQYIAAPHLYSGVTDAELATMPISHYVTILGGVRYVGTAAPVTALAEKEIAQPEPEVAGDTTDTLAE